MFFLLLIAKLPQHYQILAPDVKFCNTGNNRKAGYREGIAPNLIISMRGKICRFSLETTQILAFNFSRSKAETLHFNHYEQVLKKVISVVDW